MLVEKEIKDIYVFDYMYYPSSELFDFNSVEDATNELNNRPVWYYNFYVDNWTIAEGNTWFAVRPPTKPWYIPLYTWIFDYDTTTQTWSGMEVS